MTKYKFKDLPSKETPVKAENVNKLNNLAIDSTIEGHDEEVVLVKTKNLLKFEDTTYTSNGLTASVKNGKITISGTATASYFSWWISDIINLEELRALPLNKILTFSLLDIVGTLAKQIFINTEGHNYYYQPDSTSKYVTKSLVSKITGIQIYFTTTIGTEYNISFSPMLEKGSIAHEFEPYITSNIKINKNETYEKYTDTINVGVVSNNAGLWVKCSKNKLKMPLTTETKNGVTCKVNDDGTITLNGTSTANTNFRTNGIKIPGSIGDTVTLSGNNLDGIGNIGFKNSYSGTDIYAITPSNSSKTKTLSSNDFPSATMFDLYILANKTFNNQRMSIMLENGSVAHDFEPYLESSSIKVNNNGGYETVANKNVYSTDEVVVGEYIGKPLYRKVLTGKMGTCTTDGTYGTANNISVSSNIETIVNLSATMKIGNQVYPLMYMNNSGRVAKCLFDGGNGVQLTTNGTSFSQQNCTIIVEYTKTTDTTSTASVVSDEPTIDGPTI